MTEFTPAPWRVQGVTAALLRPLPAIFTAARLAAAADGLGPAGRRIFTAHLRALRAMLVALARQAGLPTAAIGPLLRDAADLAAATPADLADHLAVFQEHLLALHDEHGDRLKEAARDQADRLGRLFRAETGPLRLLAVHGDETRALAGALSTRLIDGCWYDAAVRHQEAGPGGLADVDLVLLVTGQRPLRVDIEQAVAAARLPSLVLMDAVRKGGRGELAALRTAHRYRRQGRRVLYGPYAAIRLYQAIDGCRLQHAAARFAPALELQSAGA